jgi:YidC/Oxa1 family membrane protein insertase
MKFTYNPKTPVLFYFFTLVYFSFTPITYSQNAISTNFNRIQFNTEGDLYSISNYFPNLKKNKTTYEFAASKTVPLFKINFNNTQNDSLSKDTFYTQASGEHIKYVWQKQSIDGILRKEYSVSTKTHLISISITRHYNNQAGSKRPISIVFNADKDPALSKLHLGEKTETIHSKDTTLKIHDTPDSWNGYRNKFWTTLVKTSSKTSVENGSFFIAADPSEDSLFIDIYSGPVAFTELKNVDSKLTRLLYPLWLWMRWLTIGFLYLFNLILSLVDNIFIAIILLSISVKIILLPLFKIASKLQKKVNIQKSIIEPRLSEIRKKFKGEEQTQMILALHKEMGISPLYTLKSLLSAAIQIPVFFAAYHMLSEHIALSGIPFLWIADLSYQDQLIKLPIHLPFFGDHLNILPFIMTSITIISSWIHTDASLSEELHKKQRTSLFFMAGLFLILLYTSPAGMVIYWTMNNLLSFLSSFFGFLKNNKSNASVHLHSVTSSKNDKSV